MQIAPHFASWRKVLGQPDWYINLYPELKKMLVELALLPEQERLQIKNEFYDFFEQEIAAGHVAFGATGKNFDAERKPIDTVVIHHTENPPGITWQRVNVIQLLKLYVPDYIHPSYEADKEIEGKPIYSGHFRSGEASLPALSAGQTADRQVFYAYHWLVRGNGDMERMLKDNEVGWHAGNWAVNCRSVGICLDNDYTNARPSDVELEAIAKLIKTHYPQISKENVIGHREVNSKKNCPSSLFLSTPEVHGWKEDLLALLE